MLLDTSGLLCLFHSGEKHHANACALFAAARSKLTHSYVLAEFVALAMIRRLPRQPSLLFLTGVLEDRTIDVIWVGEALHRAALVFLQARPDKSYSACDAVSFLLMRQRGVMQALTTDRHFEQEGFERLLLA